MTRRQRELRDLLVGLVGSPVSLEPLKHKPGRRLTLRAVAPGGSVIAKLYASERAPRVAGRLRALAEGPAEPLVPRVLLCDQARRLVVLSHVPGTPLREAVLSNDLEAAARAGSALGAWHAFWIRRVPSGLSRHTPKREVEIVDARSGALTRTAAERVRRLARRLCPSWTHSTVVHRDLYEDQVMVGERIGLIDLDDAALGPPELDIGNLLAHVELRALRAGVEPDGIRAALLEGYSASGAVLDPELLDRCRRLSHLRLACIHGEARLLSLAASPAPGTPT